MTNNQEKLLLNAVHKWVATGCTICALMWGSTAYYVNSEDTKTRLTLQAQITVLQAQQQVNVKVNQLVVDIDKKLSNIETSLTYQTQLIHEVKELRDEVNKLKVELAKRI